MGDLISRSELLKNYNKLPIQRVDMVDCGDMYRNRPLVDLALVEEMINAQPTAYDIDKVVDELKADSSVKLYGSRNSGNYMIPVDRAVEIVKQGGVFDDVCEWEDCIDGIEHTYTVGCNKEAVFSQCFETEYTYCPYCGKKIKAV